MSHTYRLYGTTIESTRAFTRRLPSTTAPPTLQLREAAPLPTRSFWPQLREVCASSPPDDTIPSTLYRHPGQETYALRFRDAVDYVITPDTISHHLHDDRLAHAVELWLLGPVLSLWNEVHGRPALHASAVAVDGHAVGFLATKKGGKSTLAAALMKEAGCPLLTDDILVLDEDAGRVVGRPSYPQMRMWTDQARHFVGQATALPRVVPDLSKRRVPVGPNGFGTFREAAAPVTHLFLPERRPEASSVRMLPVSPQNAVRALIRHAFLPHTVDHLNLASLRLPLLTTLVEQVRMHRLVYPTGVDHLPRVTEALLKEI